MEIKVDQLDGYMNSLFGSRDFSTLEKVAYQVVKQRPEIATAWRYLGIAKVLTGQEGKKNCNYSAKINNKVLDTVFVAKKSKSMRPAERVLKSQSRPITSQFLPFISINLGCQRLKNHQPHNAARTTKIVF